MERGEMPIPVRKRFLAVVSAVAVSACGGGAATLHPAHTLPLSRVSAGAGVSAAFSFGEGQRAIDQGHAAGAPGGSSANAEQQFLAGAAANALLAPGLAPWVGARTGLGGQYEAGLTYTGRTARIDARHAFESDSVALSIGAGASAVLFHLGSSGNAAPSSVLTAGRYAGSTNEFSAGGFGFDIPVLVGWRSTAQVVQAWAGLRAGFERVAGDLPLAAAIDANGESRLTANRFWGSGLVGAAVGLEPFWIALELDVAYSSISVGASFPAEAGAPSERDASFTGWSVAPTGAIVGKF
jgi:hypothetical protein